MADPKLSQDKRAPRLADILTPDQDAQLAQILAELMTQRWAILEIEMIDGKLTYYRPIKSIRVVYTNALEK